MDFDVIVIGNGFGGAICGCRLAEAGYKALILERGRVVDPKGEVFGYRNLYAVDGAIIPEALGVSPSRTIGALAERTAKIIKDERR